MARFTKGKSGNPARRPKTESTLLRKALSDRGADVAGVVLSAALAGDLTACKLVLERLIPPLKATAAPIAIALPSGAGLTDLGKTILTAAASGKLPPDIAGQLIASIGTLARVAEIDEFDKRLKLLEEGNYSHD